MTVVHASKKTALVFGVANNRSIAWACVRSLLSKNYNVIFTYQNQRFAKTAQALCHGQESTAALHCLECNVERDIPTVLQQQVPELLQGSVLDTIVHSVAYAPPDAMKEGTLLGTSREAFTVAHDVSTYSLLEIAKHSTELIHSRNGASITTLSYLGASRAIPHYNVMGPAKASLEALVRGLALELGPPYSIRVNAVSAGPVNTMAARGITQFSSLRQHMEKQAPLRRNVAVEEVADTVTFLAQATGITGQTIYVDAGYSIVAGPENHETNVET